MTSFHLGLLRDFDLTSVKGSFEPIDKSSSLSICDYSICQNAGMLPISVLVLPCLTDGSPRPQTLAGCFDKLK